MGRVSALGRDPLLVLGCHVGGVVLEGIGHNIAGTEETVSIQLTPWRNETTSPSIGRQPTGEMCDGDDGRLGPW